MTEYKMLAGMMAFVVIITSVMMSASGGLKDSSIGVHGAGWPPPAPKFTLPWTIAIPADCGGILEALVCLGAYILAFITYIIGGFLWIANAIVWIFLVLTGVFQFAIPQGLNPVLDLLGSVLAGVIILIVGLLLFRILRSVVPMVSGE